MMAPEEIQAARDGASHWLQLRIESVAAPGALPGVCVVHCAITRTLRGAPLTVTAIDVEIECKRKDRRSPPGDEGRVEVENLWVGQHLEAFVAMEGNRYRVMARQVQIVPSPEEQSREVRGL